MSSLPSFIRIRIAENGSKGFGFWIPMWIFWIPMIVIYILLLPLIILADIIMKIIGQDYKVFTITWELFPLISALRGLDVHVWNKKTNSEVVIKIS